MSGVALLPIPKAPKECRAPSGPQILSAGVRLDNYDQCGCNTVARITDPFLSSSGAFGSPEMVTPNAATSVLLLSHGRLQSLDLLTREITVLHHQPGLRIRGAFLAHHGAEEGLVHTCC
jgi:hypothetical protein